MLTKAITYENYNGEKRTQNFYFNLTKTELTKMELGSKAGIEATIKEIINTNDNERIMDLFENLILNSVGKKSVDGETFEKSDEIRNWFKSHPAYDKLFMELLSSEKAMADFINAILPFDIAENSKNINGRKKLNDLMGYEVVPEKSEDAKPEMQLVTTD